ncbi:DUF6702 family protein [Belliella pelovolcani]|uniref:DUF6702 family protein n=1 Tax=Belliella pelovolcani TaxID=529505 RepID=UPI00391D7EE7
MFILGWKVMFHPFYISLTDIRFNDKEKSIEIAQKIFWDDLEVALAKTFDTKVDFMNPDSPNRLEDMIKKYLLMHNQVTINGKRVKLEYLGYEIEDDAAWFYMEGKALEKPITVEIYNSLLVKEFAEQQNLINFYIDKKPKSLILYKDKTSGILKF